MKKLIIAALMVLGPRFAFAAYFDTIVNDPLHPKTSATALFTAAFDYDAAEASIAAVFHKANPNDTWLPRALLDWGVEPISWTLLELGGGGNKDHAFGTAGASIDLAQTLLGPVAAALRNLGGKSAKAGNLIVSPDGDGVKLSLGWEAAALENGALQPLNHWRFPPRYGVGYSYTF